MVTNEQAVRPDQDFDRFLAEGRFMLQRSRSSQRYVFPPRVAEPGTGARDLEWVEASGRATVHSWTVVAQKPPALGYSVALVDLAEGPRMVTRLHGVPPRPVRIGEAVQARIVDDQGSPLLVFEPVDAA